MNIFQKHLRRKIAALGTGTFAFLAAMFFIANMAYMEWLQYVLAPLFLVFLSGFYVFFTRSARKTSVFFLLLAILTFGFSHAKYQWRKSFFKEHEAGRPFMVRPYLDDYPPLEVYLLAPYTGWEDWVRFNRDCVEPYLKTSFAEKACSTTQAIQDAYHINVQTVLQAYQKRMKTTAEMVDKKIIRNKLAYLSCIDSGNCVPVPLLPKDVKAEDIDPASEDYKEIREPFWTLLKSEKLTQGICEHILLCRVLGGTGALKVYE